VWESALGAAGDGQVLLERDEELAALRAAVNAARARAGAVVVIQGPPGAGKSALLSAAESDARRSGMKVLSGRGRELESTVALGVATELLAPPVLAAPAAERARLLAGLAAPAGPLLVESAGQAPAAADATLRGLCWVAAHLAGWNLGAAGSGPLLITVDDVQWADSSSLRFLAMLADRADRLPLSLVVAVRDGEPADDNAALQRLSRHPRARLLTPVPLTAAAVGQLTFAAFPEAGADLADAVAHASGGNPFFASELLRSLRASGGTPAAGAVERLLPESVLRSVLSRLSRLPREAATLAASVAVLGDGVPLRRAAAHAALAPAQAEQAADLLAAVRLLRGGNPLAFTHALVGTAIYADLPGFARARAHRRAADLLAAEGEGADRVAGHLLAAEPDGDQASVAVLTEAARRALMRGDPAAAVRLLRRALAEPPRPGERAGLLIELARAQATDGDATAHTTVSEALTLLGPAEVHARAAALDALARIHRARGERDLAAAVGQAALDLLDPRDPAWPDALTEYLTVATFHPALQSEVGMRVAPLLRDAREGSLPRQVRLLACVTLRLALAGDPPAAVRAAADRAFAADPLVDPSDHGMLFALVDHALVIAGEWVAAEAAADTAMESASRRGDLLAYSAGCFHRALSRFRRGALTAALADQEAAARTGIDAGWGGAVGWVAGLGADIHLDLGDHAAARMALRRAAECPPDSMDAALVSHARARLALADHDPAAALAAARDAGQHLERTFRIDHPGLLPWRITAALAAHHLGRHDEARRLAAAALDRARSTGIAAHVGTALRITGLVARPGADTAILAEAAELLAETPAALEHARALVELGAALRRAGRRDASRGPLRDGLALADRLRARPLAERARAELGAAGARPRRPATAGIGALTPAERRVALLALHGDGNATIAQTLFVTTKTVETHLSRAYRKLGISGRRQLLDAFGSVSPPSAPDA
jgi:DNA-binding CsgD family transcriptional regulator